jgi:hypothetical protein
MKGFRKTLRREIMNWVYAAGKGFTVWFTLPLQNLVNFSKFRQ